MAYLSEVAPVNRTGRILPAADHTLREGLFRTEKEILRQEKNLARNGTVTSAHYTYTPGPDGKLYITGATVTVRRAGEKGKETRGSSEKTAGTFSRQKDLEIAAASSRLKAIERDVIAHEAAHKSAGGPYAGAISYRYITGPDGRRYITGGKVSISAPGGDTPEETLRIMEQVKNAALAPGSPSGQDLQVAAAASAAASRARAEMNRLSAQKAYENPGASAGEELALSA